MRSATPLRASTPNARSTKQTPIVGIRGPRRRSSNNRRKRPNSNGGRRCVRRARLPTTFARKPAPAATIYPNQDPDRQSRITPDVADVAMDNSTHSGNRLANCAEPLFQIMAARLFHPGADPADSVHSFRVFQPPEFTHPAVRVFYLVDDTENLRRNCLNT